MIENPLKELRKKYGLSGLKMSLILKVNSSYYYTLEAGYLNLTKTILKRLQDNFNIEPDTFKKQFEEWRLERKKEILREVKNGS